MDKEMDKKMTEGKVSVIIPVYNGAAWIRECLESVLSQTWGDFEILVLDDHSTDGTTQIIQDMSRKDQRIQLILRNGKGVSAARNQGIEQSDGEYITFLDADDKLDNRMLERLMQYLKEEGSDMVSCGYHRWTLDFKANQEPEHREGGQNVSVGQYTLKRTEECADNYGGKAGEKYIVRTVSQKSYVADYLLHQYTHCWGILYRRSVIGETRFREDLTIGEDMMFLVDLLPKLTKVSITDYKGYYYRINEAGVTLRPFVPAYMDEIKSWYLAADVIRKDYPECLPQIESILAVSGILVAGKIALLSRKDRKKYRNYVQACQKTVKEALKVPGARENLPDGYGIKAVIFTYCPWIYLKMYHLWKGR